MFFRLSQFGGMIPIQSSRLLPENMAEFAANVDLESGEIRPIQLPAMVHEFTGPQTIHRAERLPDPDDPNVPVWVGFESRFARIFPSPISNDAYDRYLWIDNNGPGQPATLQINSFARLKAGEPARTLGIPAPTQPLVVTHTGGSGPTETRFYTYTLVDEWGQEGPPGPVTQHVGPNDATYQIIDFTVPTTLNYIAQGVNRYRLYRTITGQSVTSFFRVADITIPVPAAPIGYTDTRPSSTVAAEGLLLESSSWGMPEQMEGIIAMPGGFFAGWRGQDVFFSVPYRPWAWPAELTLSVRHRIVGAGTIGSTLVLLTESKPVLISGSRPETMVVERSDSIEPCVSPNAVVTTPEGVYFAGRAGLLYLTPGGVTNLTRDLISQTQWRDEYLPQNLSVVKLNDTQVMAFSSDGNGFILDLATSRSALTGLFNFAPIDSAWTDQFNAKVLLACDNKIYEWAQRLAPYSIGRWHSKEFQVPKPINLGALIVSLDTSYSPQTPSIPSVILQPYDAVPGGPWTDKAAVYDYCQYDRVMCDESPAPGTYPPGATMGQNVGLWPNWYGLVDTTVVTPIDLNLPPGIACYVALFARGEKVWESYVENGVMYRTPSGLKSDVWQVMVLTRVPVLRLQLAETGKELADV